MFAVETNCTIGLVVKIRHALKGLGLGVSVLAFAAPAHAAWRVAETEHFKIYSEATPEELSATVTRLEKFDKIVRVMTGNSKPASPVKVTMFQVRDMLAVAQTIPYPTRGIGGYYTTSFKGPHLIAMRQDLRESGATRGRASQSIRWGPEVTQHEYLHHYMYQYFPANYPTWYSEGFAEYYGTMAFGENNSVEIGHAPFFRMDVIKSSWLKAKDLLAAKSYADVTDVGPLYAEGWLLTHYGAQNKERGKHLADYLNKVAKGMPYPEAASAAFGDLDQLDKELKAHAKNLTATRFSLKPIDIGPVAMRELGPLENALLRYEIGLRSGFRRDDMARISDNVRAARAGALDDPYGLAVQAEIDLLAENPKAALVSADKLVKLKPDDPRGLLAKGRAELELLGKAAGGSQGDAARQSIARAAKLEPANPEPLVAYYHSYADAGVLPPPPAQNALMSALKLLPQDPEIRYMAAADFEKRGMIDEAILVISPAAYGSFDGDDGEERKRDKETAKAAAMFTGVTAHETPKKMLERLTAAKAKSGTAVASSGS